MKIVVIGATSCIAQHCLRILCKEANEIILVGRNEESLQCVKADLLVRNEHCLVSIEMLDFTCSESINGFAVICEQNGVPDLVIIAHGVLPEQQIQHDLTAIYSSLEINAISPILFVETFLPSMERIKSGHIVVFGSVAGDRGRKSNYIYGAAKGFIEKYLEGVSHRVSSLNINITLVKPGPTKSPMTANLSIDNLSLAEPSEVAKDIVKGINAKRSVVYTPKKWYLIMFIITRLPKFIFNKLNI